MECNQDTCCVWNYVQEELVSSFRSENGTCNRFARAAVRLGFHDAGAWSITSGYGGADGSILLNSNEISRSENSGLQDIHSQGLDILRRYRQYGVGAADLVQFMHNVATVVCPFGPRLLTFVGRRDNSSSPSGLLPDAQSPANKLIELFSTTWP